MSEPASIVVVIRDGTVEDIYCDRPAKVIVVEPDLIEDDLSTAVYDTMPSKTLRSLGLPRNLESRAKSLLSEVQA
jgi:hypothetical protein